MDASIVDFSAITSADPETAARYLQLTDGNLEQAISLFFESPNLDVGTSTTEPSSTTHIPTTSGATSSSRGFTERDGVIHIDSDDEPSTTKVQDIHGPTTTPGSLISEQAAFEDDEAMARRLQEELYASAETEVRAPMARTTETLVGPGSTDWFSGPSGPEDMGAPLDFGRRRRQGRPGIFNQRATSASIWDSSSDSSTIRRGLAEATGGASEASSKSARLAELFRPPFEIMYQNSWEEARDEGKESEKWMLVNVQDSAIFDCQVLNRDIWKHPQIKETIRENFIFLQYLKDDTAGRDYVQYYFHARDSQDAYPHIAIVDPRTGEQVKVWSGRPVPEATDFLMQLHEFLDRYSLKANARNPVATRKPDRKKVDIERMTEEEMLEMALQNSLANNGGPREDDPDELTRQPKGKEKLIEIDDDDESMEVDKEVSGQSPFARISSSHPHTEPPNDLRKTTRIQFRHSGGRVIRRFELADPVLRIYEWLKAAPLEGKADQEFELTFMGKNLIDLLDVSIEQAGLKNGTVMVEFIE